MSATFNPATADLAELRADLARIRQERGRGSGYTLDAFNRLNAASHAQGQPLNGLRRYSGFEKERFFACTIPGPDGHVYWDGPKSFKRNDGRTRFPARWWWEHLHGEIASKTLRLYPVCGDGACINPEHRELRHFREGTGFSDQQMLGGLQVMAMRLGHAPSSKEWEAHGGRPYPWIFAQRFGSWPDAIRAAGLNYESWVFTPRQCIQALRVMRRVLGRWPTSRNPDFAACRSVLHEHRLPSTSRAIRHHLGGNWEEALRRAGKR